MACTLHGKNDESFMSVSDLCFSQIYVSSNMDAKWSLESKNTENFGKYVLFFAKIMSVLSIKVWISRNIDKGQLISICITGVPSKKRTKNFCRGRLGQKIKFSSSFFWKS